MLYVVVLEEPSKKNQFLEEPSCFLGRTQLISWKNPVVGSNSGNTTKMSIRTQLVGTIRTQKTQYRWVLIDFAIVSW